jgi:cis-L-3-hydroxyproline dehydratase
MKAFVKWLSGGIHLVLTNQEKQMLSGDLGPGIAKALEIQLAIGEAFGAERMVEISRAHESFYASESCTWFLELFADLNARCRVPTTCNPIFDDSYFERMGKPIPKEDLIYVRRTREARKRIGIFPNECCTPYLQDNVPAKGEIIAFSESNATCYANSICGARSHRESAISALAAAVTGRVPLYGLLLKENRVGDTLIKVEAQLRDDFDYHLLGYTLGKEVGADIPIFAEMSSSPPSPEEIISLGAELATSGTVSMYHIAGLTPEAPDVETALEGKAPKKRMTVTEAMLKKAKPLCLMRPGKSILSCSDAPIIL